MSDNYQGGYLPNYDQGGGVSNDVFHDYVKNEGQFYGNPDQQRSVSRAPSQYYGQFDNVMTAQAQLGQSQYGYAHCGQGELSHNQFCQPQQSFRGK